MSTIVQKVRDKGIGGMTAAELDELGRETLQCFADIPEPTAEDIKQKDFIVEAVRKEINRRMVNYEGTV